MSSGAWIVAGAGVGALAALVGGIVERSFRMRGELVAAAAEWLAAAETFSQIAQRDAALSEPPSNPGAAFADRLIESIVGIIGKGRVEGLRMLVHRSYVDRVDQVVDRMTLATTRLVLTAPLALVNRLSPHIATLMASTANPTDAELARRWNEEGRTAVTRLLRLWTQPVWRHPIRRIRALLERPPSVDVPDESEASSTAR